VFEGFGVVVGFGLSVSDRCGRLHESENEDARNTTDLDEEW
jgi:hypothetical protein